MGVYEEQIVPIKISRLAEYVSQRKHISLEEALKIGNSPVDPKGEMVRIARQLGIYVGE